MPPKSVTRHVGGIGPFDTPCFARLLRTGPAGPRIAGRGALSGRFETYRHHDVILSVSGHFANKGTGNGQSRLASLQDAIRYHFAQVANRSAIEVEADAPGIMDVSRLGNQIEAGPGRNLPQVVGIRVIARPGDGRQEPGARDRP
mgnify:CR=1 FL=1